MELDEESRKKVAEYQTLQQQLQMVALQRQQTALQLQENSRALEELGRMQNDVEAYRQVGLLFVPKKPEPLKNELNTEKESLELRQKTVEKQEKKLVSALESLKKDLEAALGKKGAE